MVDTIRYLSLKKNFMFVWDRRGVAVGTGGGVAVDNVLFNLFC